MAKQSAPTLRLAGPARRDIAAIIRWSFTHFGEAAALRYEALIAQALKDLQAEPSRPGSRERPEMMVQDPRTYHLFFSSNHVAGGRVKEPRHFILYRCHEGVVEISRILHDSRDLRRHLPEDYKLLGD